MSCEILQQDVQGLLEHFAKNIYKAKESENGTMVKSFFYNFCIFYTDNEQHTTTRNSLK